MKIEARLSRGLRDLLPEQMLARQRMIDTIRGVYELYGFSPLETPAVEYLDVLSGSAGEEAQGSIFRVTNPEEEALGLRFDLTVPLSRVVSQYKDLVFPFRRYQVSPVWRADKPAPGRFRQFTQFDLDSVGEDANVDIGVETIVPVDDGVRDRLVDDPERILLYDLEAERSHLDAAGQFIDHELLRRLTLPDDRPTHGDRPLE